MPEIRSTLHLMADNVVLTGSVVNASSVLTSSHDQFSAYIQYDPDTNSTNELEVYFEASHDDENTTDANSAWFQIGRFTNTSGSLTKEAHTVVELSAGTSAQRLPPYTFDVSAKKIRVAYKETNTPGDFGNVTINVLSRSS